MEKLLSRLIAAKDQIANFERGVSGTFERGVSAGSLSELKPHNKMRMTQINQYVPLLYLVCVQVAFCEASTEHIAMKQRRHVSSARSLFEVVIAALLGLFAFWQGQRWRSLRACRP